MATLIDDGDLPARVVSQLESDELDTMLNGLNAKAVRVAPCLGWTGVDADHPVPSDDVLAEAKLILLGIVKRWAEAGSGAFTQKTETTGPYSSMQTVDTRQRTGYNLWPTEITQLQDLCRTADSTATAFSIDTAPSLGCGHLLWCSLNFGATYCSCGVDIAGEPIYELG